MNYEADTGTGPLQTASKDGMSLPVPYAQEATLHWIKSYGIQQVP